MGLVRGLSSLRGLTRRSPKSNFKKVIKDPLIDTEKLDDD